MRAFFAVFWAQTRIFLRTPADLFLTLGLPLVFVLIFGFIWGSTDRLTRLGVVLSKPDELVNQVLSEFSSLAVERFPNREELEVAVARRQVDYGMIWDGAGLVFLFERSRVQDNPDFEAQARRIGRALELALQGLAQPVRPERVHVGRLFAATWFHYIVPGLMAMAILQAGVFAVAGRIAGMRDLGILRRMLVTPLSGWAILLGVGLVRMGVGFFSAGLNLIFAGFVFGVRFPVSFGSLLFYAVVCALGGMGLGAAVSLVAKKPGSAAAVGMILVQAMLFLSGIYIPFEFLPPALRTLGQILPAYHMAQGFRTALGVVEGGAEILWASLGFGSFGLLALLLFGRLFLRAEKG